MTIQVMSGHYEILLVVVSVLVAVFASYTALMLAERVSGATSPSARWAWIAGGAVAMGSGIWSMHFIGMLSFRLPIPLGYEFSITLLSWLIPVAASALALWLLSRDNVKRWQLGVCAMLIGLGIAAMHYVGMAAMLMQPGIEYDPLLVLLSIGIAVGAVAAALGIAVRLRRQARRAWRMRLAAATVMGAAIAGMHYTGMAAASFPSDSVCQAATGTFTLSGLAIMVIVATVGVLGIALLTAVYDARLAAHLLLAQASERHAEERQRLLDQEHALRTEAERLNAIKDQFLAVLSHELRTPLNVILGWTQLLQRKNDIASMVRGLSIIDRNARLQAQLIEDLLEMSRIVSGTLRLEFTEVDLLELVHEQLDAMRPAAHAKSIELTMSAQPSAERVRADRTRLLQVVGNLLTNAIKFTPERGRVDVTVRVDAHGAIVEVSDSGIGIDSGFLPHVFDTFRQEDASRTRRHSGLGIGLAIARQLVGLHGGVLDAASEGSGCGATFTLRLPLSETSRLDHSPLHKPTVAHQDHGLAGLNVLVVDDDVDARGLMREILTTAGACVTLAASGKEALCALGNVSPDVIVSDIGMPEMDGFELMRRIRHWPEPRISEVPSIALSAYLRLEDSYGKIGSGFTAFQPKPLNLPLLIEQIEALAKNRTAEC